MAYNDADLIYYTVTVPKKLLLTLGCLMAASSFYFGGPKGPPISGSITINDHSGKPLMTLDNESKRQSFITFEEIPVRVILSTLAAEDQQFFEHHGIDGLATLRAIKDNLTQGKITSGASTISQQVARHLLGINRARTYLNKAEEIATSVALEQVYTKPDIITYYLNHAFYGNNSYGIQQAALTYFESPLTNLDWNQITLLAALPQNANYLNPYNNMVAVRKRQIIIAERLGEREIISRDELKSIKTTIPHLSSSQTAITAPHFSYFIIQQLEDRYGKEFWQNHQVTITTTLDRDLYQQQREIIDHELEKINDKGVHNAASIMIDNQTGNVLSYIGNKDYFDTKHNGAVDMVQAKRQPGSALKPFIYLGTILFKGLGTGSVFFDVPTQFQTNQDTPYTPLNYDLDYHGPVTMREALANSYNIPAVQALEKIGGDQAIGLLQKFGITTLSEGSNHYGLSLALGSGEVTLAELANAYRSLANQGTFSPLRSITSIRIDGEEKIAEFTSTNKTLTSFTNAKLKAAISMITDIISDNDARLTEFGENNVLDFGKKIAAKTGTSRNFHDNWTLGYSKNYTVGVWVGNSDGTAMQQISGITGAGPIFHGLMTTSDLQPLPDLSPEMITTITICLPSGLLPTQYCSHQSKEQFLSSQIPTEYDTWYQKDGLHLPGELSFWQQRFTTKSQPGLQIVSPHDHDVFRIDPELPLASQKIPCSIFADQVSNLQIMLNDKVISNTCTLPLQAGQYHLVVRGTIANQPIEHSLNYSITEKSTTP